MKVARITGLLAILMGLILSAELAAGPINPANKVKTKIIFSEIKGEHRPVIGVISSKEVVVLLKDEQRKRTRPKQVRAVEKQLPPVGRVTICSTEGVSEWENSVMGGWVTNYTQTSFAFDLVADREIRNAYIALFYEFPENRSSGIAFCSLGDLPAGELVHREAFFQNVKLPRGTSYRFTIYAEGMPVEKFFLNRVATLPRSQGLLIPWEIRLKHYIEQAQANGTSRMPNPFDVGFTHLDKSQIKDRGIESAKVGILVHVDGRVSLEKGDGQLSEEDLKQLSRDISGWRFFPALKEGEPYERRVSIPLQFTDTTKKTHSIRYGRMSWHEAKAKAEEAGGYLACIETQEEMDYVQSLRENRKTLWVGLTDEDSEGDWYWINGVPLDLDMKDALDQGLDLHVRDYAHIRRQGGLLSREDSGVGPRNRRGSDWVEGYVIEWD